jgi:hypothetical protein
MASPRHSRLPAAACAYRRRAPRVVQAAAPAVGGRARGVAREGPARPTCAPAASLEQNESRLTMRTAAARLTLAGGLLGSRAARAARRRAWACCPASPLEATWGLWAGWRSACCGAVSYRGKDGCRAGEGLRGGGSRVDVRGRARVRQAAPWSTAANYECTHVGQPFGRGLWGPGRV